MNVFHRSFFILLSCLLPLTSLQAETITVGGMGGLTPLMQKLAEPDECRSLSVPSSENK